jgi:hypothetical protein
MLSRDLIHRIGMQQSTQRATIDNQPRNKGAELRWRVDVHLEHSDRVRPDRDLPELVDAELWDWSRRLMTENQHNENMQVGGDTREGTYI